MQEKMLNEVLEVALALQAQDLTNKRNALAMLKDTLNEMQMHGELTAKQKRVLNCLCTVTRPKGNGRGTATVYPAGC